MKNKAEIILVGGGGHCKSCIDVIEAEGRFSIKGIIDRKELLGSEIVGYPVIGNDDDLIDFAKSGNNFLITLGFIKSSKRRNELYEEIVSNGGNFPNIISPRAQVSKHSSIAKGTIVMHDCLVNTGSQIGENCIINSKALIEHDVKIGSNCHVSTHSTINGDCTIGDNVFIGSSSVIKNGISVKENTTIGIGSLVIRSLEESGVYVGNPVKLISK